MPPDLETSLPPDVQALLADVDSFEKLEILCRLVQESGRDWPQREVARDLNLSSDVVERALDELAAAGITLITKGFVRLAAGDRIDTARKLAQRYQEDRVTVIRAITESAFSRIRCSAARTFADAFVLRRPSKKEPGDG